MIACGAYETQLGAGNIISPSKRTCSKNINSFEPGPIITLSEV